MCLCGVYIHTRVPQRMCGVQRTALWASCLCKPLCGLNLGRQACVASVLPAEPSHHPRGGCVEYHERAARRLRDNGTRYQA